MGKNLLIKGADFHINAIENIPPTPPTPSDLLYEFNGSVNGEQVDIGLKLFTELTNWTMFVSWNNIAVTDATVNTMWFKCGHYNEGELMVCAFNKNSGKYYTKFCNAKYYIPDGLNYIESVQQTGKIGFRRNGNIGQITFDGVTWQNSNIVLPTATDYTLNVKKPNVNGTAVIKLYNSSDKDISQLFSYQ